MKLVDLHEDLAYAASRADVVSGRGQSSIELLRGFEQAVVFAALFPQVEMRGHRFVPSMDLLLEQVKLYLKLEREGLAKIMRGGAPGPGINLLMSLEGLDALREPMDLLPLRELGVRAVGLTWNFDNAFAASCMSKKDYGLTGMGEELVKLANELGIIIDVAHASERTVLDVASITRKPIIASHANARHVVDHPRNLSDSAIEAIVKTDGVVGVTAITSTLPRGDIEGMAENMRYIGESFGWRHVALGTDFLGIDEPPRGFGSVADVGTLIELAGGHWEALWENPIRVIRANLQ